MKIQLRMTGINYILKYIQIEIVILTLQLQYYWFFLIFHKINAYLQINLTDPKLLNSSIYIYISQE